ncbi:hypothetical protein [Aurantimonas sp. HBX-1]|uniref:hypothetical protein n=1 Tax=Aurantimonas sp. HBX-1 TaxID=2906072 RepID=UPI001F3FE717|nr:hypothetical protein [Aurantimonas sp. HBX-1]UIJ73484.1 hypothetical protein LXB15_07590 [Aurantimonas sp. HBX-1]
MPSFTDVCADARPAPGPERSHGRRLRLPLLSVGITDDAWGTPAAVSALLRRFPNADLTTVAPAS